MFFKDEIEIAKVTDLDEGDIVTITGKVSGKSMNVGIDNSILND